MILEAKNINKFFYEPERFQVLNSVSLSLKQGELISLYGESGSGKSTLLYILSTLDSDYEGTLTLKGTDTKSLSPVALTDFRNQHIGFVYQFHFLLHEFNVLQNVMLPALKLGNKSTAQIREEALLLLEEMEMMAYAKRRANKLSGGQQQRVAIARALINDPDIIIADEPTGNLDQKNTRIIFNLLQEITEKKGKTVIMATHNAYIRKNSGRSIEMIDGTLRL